MSATAPGFSGEAGLAHQPVDSEDTSPLSDGEGASQHQTPNGVRQRKDSSVSLPDLFQPDRDGDDITQTSLRPEPPPSRKRRESEVDNDSTDLADKSNQKKRKRAESPPWHFPTAETTTLKTADGRRVSARVNTGTPPVNSDASARARSSSVSVPPAIRSRPESPPWKRFGAEGPTSVVVDGKRKSGRVNKELADQPKRVSPRLKKQHSTVDKRLSNSSKLAQASKALHTALSGTGHSKQQASSAKKPTDDSSRPPSSSDSAAKIAELRAQIEALQPARSFPSPERLKHSKHKRKRSDGRDPPTLDGPSSPPNKMLPPNRLDLSPDIQRPSPRIKLRFNAARHAVPPPHPHAVFPSPIKPPNLSMFQKIEEYELAELQQPYSENERGPPDMAWFLQRAERQAMEEGTIRKKILQEAQPGGKLSKERLSIYQEAEPQREPGKQYGHEDHLTAHVLYLRHLQLREKTNHRVTAKKVAHEALEMWKAMRGPTKEDLEEEQEKMFRLIYKQVAADMRARWDMVFSHVQRRRMKIWEAEEDQRRRVRLEEKLERSQHMVARQRGEAEVDLSDDEDLEEGSAEDSDDESEEENMSESSSEANASGEDNAGGDEGEMGEDELAAYLAQRKSEDRVEPQEPSEDVAPNRDEEEESESDSDPDDDDADDLDVPMADLLGESNSQEEEQDDEFEPGADELETPVLEDPATDNEHPLRRSRRSSATPALDGDDEQDLSSDESTNMDSTDYDSDEDMSSTGEEDNAADEDEGHESGTEQFVPKNSLLSLFKDEVKASGLPTPTLSAEGDEGERQAEAGAVVHAVDIDVDAKEREDGDLVLEVEEEVRDQKSSRDAEAPTDSAILKSPESSDVESIDAAAVKHLVPSPSLLRGTLRSYQHAGLDWLASLYRNGTNGILADEMGLGKTIQTIALLAHLAEEYECWDPHLVIVPTSVVLNWVTEFQRFLPGFRVLGYYGSSDDRQLKRKGWINDPHDDIKERRGYNVVVTSYNVAMQDINAIRNVQWHYLVLDEAHNIRNFNSQRWQVLIRLRTRARLLLTGTPLQNSLTELWSLLTFLTAGDDDPQHGDLEEFLSHWKEPVKEIFDRGVQTLSTEAQKVVDQLHVSLRPFLLRRLKSEVEKDLPKKTESVVVCKLSKRQRQLYQDYMGLAETRKSLTQGNAVTAGKVLLSLRRVCNHPDLFDPRPIQTSFGMEKSALDEYSVKEGVIRRLLGVRMDPVIQVTAFESEGKYLTKRAEQLNARTRLETELATLEKQHASNPVPDGTTLAGCQLLQRHRLRERKLAQLRSCIQVSRDGLRAVPVYGSDLRELLTIQRDKAYRVVAKDVRGRLVSKRLRGWPTFGRCPLKFELDHVSDWLLSKTTMLQQNIQTVQGYAERMQETIVKFAFCTPAATAPVLDYSIPARCQEILRALESYPLEADYAHEARIRSSIAFPDARLLVYDAGKLQRLTGLLRELQSKGSRSLIFTQMTGTLNILEQFLSLLNLPYLRLDGSTPVERRQLYAAEFNRPDSKYQCMILSSRAGGVGLNLIGASSVIFYDLDWNPQMDRQCMDRAHRIGQVRDVEVYKMVSEKTVEENILRRANQKSLLDQTVIQEGHFTTEYQQPSHGAEHAGHEDDEEGQDVAAAIERFLGGGNEKATNQALESVEDTEDVKAAQQARKEDHQDEDDFADRSSNRPSVAPASGLDDHADNDRDGVPSGHIDRYSIDFVDKVLLKDVVFVPPPVRRLDKHGRDPSHRRRKR